MGLSVPTICAAATCISKWVVRTVLRKAADGLLASWIQASGFVESSLRRARSEPKRIARKYQIHQHLTEEGGHAATHRQNLLVILWKQVPVHDAVG